MSRSFFFSFSEENPIATIYYTKYLSAFPQIFSPSFRLIHLILLGSIGRRAGWLTDRTEDRPTDALLCLLLAPFLRSFPPNNQPPFISPSEPSSLSVLLFWTASQSVGRSPSVFISCSRLLFLFGSFLLLPAFCRLDISAESRQLQGSEYGLSSEKARGGGVSFSPSLDRPIVRSLVHPSLLHPWSDIDDERRTREESEKRESRESLLGGRSIALSIVRSDHPSVVGFSNVLDFSFRFTPVR